MLKISTKVAPASVASNYSGPLQVEVSLEAPDNPVDVVFPNTIPGKLGAVLIRNVASNQVTVFRTYPGNSIQGRSPNWGKSL